MIGMKKKNRKETIIKNIYINNKIIFFLKSTIFLNQKEKNYKKAIG